MKEQLLNEIEQINDYTDLKTFQRIRDQVLILNGEDPANREIFMAAVSKDLI